MAFCSKCGASVSEGAAFCASCGVAQPAATGAVPPVTAVNSPAAAGLTENVAATLSYVLGWITGLVFFFTDKRPYVRFHAAQSIVVFGALHLISIIVGMAFGFGLWFGGGWGLGYVLLEIVRLVAIVLWVLLMIKAYQGQRYKIPTAGDIAENMAR